MKNIVKLGAASLVAYASQAQAIDFGKGKVDTELQGSTDTADGAIQTIIGNLMLFLALLAFLFLLWGGFNILTAGGDEEKVKKGKTVIIQACLGLVVIFLAWSIVSWVITLILGA